MPADDINVAIIGAGLHGRHLINCCLDIAGVRFKAVCDIWPYSQRYASGILKKRGQPVNVYEDYRDMLAAEKGLDAVIIATPDSFHAEQTIACLKAKLHVYCEKEMHTTVEGARQMVLAAREARKLLQIGRQHRSNPRYHIALDYILTKNALGHLASVSGQWHGHKRVPFKWPQTMAIPAETLKRYGFDSMEQHRNWRWFARFSAGEIANLGTHQIDVFNWFLRSPPRAVMASGGLDCYDFFELYDNAVCLFEWDYQWQGATKTVRGDYHVLTAADIGGFYEVITGTEGYLAISEDPSKGGLWRWAGDYDRWGHCTCPKADWEHGLKEIPIEEALDGPECAEARWAGLITGYWGRDSFSGFFEQVLETYRHYPPIPYPGEEKAPHWYHLKNFFDAARGTCKLTCPADVAYPTTVSVLKAVESMNTRRRIELKPADYAV